MNDEVVQLRRQNEELKHLLATYIQSHTAMHPPCAEQREQTYTKSPLHESGRKL